MSEEYSADMADMEKRPLQRGGSSSSLNSLLSFPSAVSDTTKRAWERVQERYKTNPNPKPTDIIHGLSFLNPLASSTFTSAVSICILSVLIFHAYVNYGQFLHFVASLQASVVANVAELTLFVGALLVIQLAYTLNRSRPVYIVDFATFKPPEKNIVTHDKFMELTRACGMFSEESIAFQEKLLVRNGLGPRTAFPDPMFRAAEIGKTGKPETVLNMASARQEAEEVMFTVVGDLLRANNMSPKDIDILVVNCSLFNPTPSLSAMIVNHFKMRHDIITYNLSGMGCSAGLISIDLAKDLLQVHRNSNCIVVSTENITQNWYLGKEKSMLLTNTLFRMGGAAVLLSNKSRMRPVARYELLHTVRTHRGADDPAYESVYQMEDADGIKGVRLSKSIMDVSGAALRQNITTLGPLVLSLDEQAKFLVNFFRRKYLGQKDVAPYIPNFHKAISHFCIHTGGRAVIDTLEKVLDLTEYDCEPSRFALERFGNTSSASIWYELEFMERDGRMRRGNKVWQIAFGSGFKCNSAVWRALKTVPASSTDY